MKNNIFLTVGWIKLCLGEDNHHYSEVTFSQKYFLLLGTMDKRYIFLKYSQRICNYSELPQNHKTTIITLACILKISLRTLKQTNK